MLCLHNTYGRKCGACESTIDMYLRMLRQRLQVYGGDLAGDLDLQRCETFTIALQHHLFATCKL